MDLQEALEILEIDIDKLYTITESQVKKQYRKLALLHHPDKNGNTIESKEKFQKILEAYHLAIQACENKKDENNTDDKEREEEGKTDYNNILQLFLTQILKGARNEYLNVIVREIVYNCKKVTLSLFEHLNKDQCLTIYHFIIKYKSVLHIHEETIETIKKILLDKFKDIQMYSVNPTLKDLFQNNVYRFNIAGKTYFVPLWHSELYFDPNIIVRCIPELPEHISIDEDNNILFRCTISFTSSLLTQEVYPIQLDEVTLHIPINRLFMKSHQTYTFKQMGISKIIEEDMYKVDEKSDIIVHIFLQE